MANASNALTGYWETTGTNDYKIAWTVTQNANFTYTVNIKYYINTHGTDYYVEFKPRIVLSNVTRDGTYAQYGGSTSYVLLMDENYTINCSATGSSAIAIYGKSVNDQSSVWTEVWGYLTLPSFSGAYVKIDATTYKHAMTWIKVNGTWKRCRQYTKVNGSWKLGNYVWLYNP